MPVTEEVQKLGPVFGPFLKTVLKKDICSDETSANRDVKNVEQSTDVPQEPMKNSSFGDTDGDGENFAKYVGVANNMSQLSREDAQTEKILISGAINAPLSSPQLLSNFTICVIALR